MIKLLYSAIKNHSPIATRAYSERANAARV